MKGYSGGRALLLTITLCAIWTSIVNGAATQGSTDQESTNQASADGRNDVQSEAQPYITQLLPSVIRGITNVTGKPLVVFDHRIDDINDKIKDLVKPYTNSQGAICKGPDQSSHRTNRTVFKCELIDKTILTLHTVKDRLPRVHIAVTTGELRRPTTDILCDVGKFLSTWLQETFSLKESTSEPCSRCNKICNSEYDCLVCPICKTMCSLVTTAGAYDTTTNTPVMPGDQDRQQTQPTNGDSLMPIVIACIVSFLAGVGVCLLVLCLVGHFHGRFCLNFTNSGKYVEKTAKTQNHDPKSQAYTSTASAIDMSEHEYHDLRCETLSTPCKTLPNPPEYKTTTIRKPANTAAQSTDYETMSDAQKGHVYSGLGNRESNPSTEYEHTSPNRSSEHVYSGMLYDTQPNDPMTCQQPSQANISDGIADINIDPDRSVQTTGENQKEPIDYLMLEKEQHAAIQPKPEAGQVTDESPTVTHDTVTENLEEPNNYFVLEKESHPAIQPEPEAVAEPDIGGEDSTYGTDDYHSYHTLQKL